MRFRTQHSPLLLFLLPSLVTALAPKATAPAPTTKEQAALAATDDTDDAGLSAAFKNRVSVPTKDAPVDGKDGKPHNGPFVDTSGRAKTDSKEKALPPLKGRPKDPTIIDGEKIPESNDGVMDDENRQRPQHGTTGTEGGVSEKDKARKAKEEKTGEKAVTRPEAPKEQPPLPHSEEQKIPGSKEKAKDKAKDSESSDEDTAYTGLEPFHSFVLSFTMILVSEIGDKTFLVAALMAMKHDRMVVFSAAFGALLVMTVLSAVLGHAVPSLLPKRLTGMLAAILFLFFGAKLLREGMAMDPNEGVAAEMHEVEQELAEKEKELERRGGSSLSPHALEMGLNGRGSRSMGRFPSTPRSPSESPSRHPPRKAGALGSIMQGVSNLCSLVLSPAWVQTFVMTFLGEWGDRSQIATIAMAAGQDYWLVTLGALAGHSICTGVAVIGGRAIAGRVSLKVVTVGGAIAFLVFAFIYFIEAIYA
ncbi:GCR1-dependent translation factor 1 [Escovopsis weberi]|uniref:GCR1-dependent translation factor 1 n=1 Tax=Escovopsis weberi TaxID=150374 RepID=A0A0M8N3F9_ESCWE|nr:GCR1-dependent translation factor 1 [Escovopsis weberi]